MVKAVTGERAKAKGKIDDQEGREKRLGRMKKRITKGKEWI